jgi:hypothetical protein
VIVLAKGKSAEWLVGDDDPGGVSRVVRIVTPGYAGGLVHVTVPVQFDGILETGYWTPAGSDEQALLSFAGVLEGGYWRPDAQGGYRPDFTPRGSGVELAGKPVICRSCGCATGPPGRWVIEDYCNGCSNYGGF